MAADDSVAHTVQPGDTLEALARDYLNAPQQWPLLQRRNAVANPRQLRPGSVLQIPAQLLPRAPAQVAFVQGDVRSAATPTTPAQPLQAGSTVAEGARLQVGAESFVAVRLADGSVVRVPAQSDVQLQQMRRSGRTGQVRAVIELRSGSVDADVAPNKSSRDPQNNTRRFEIRTPRAATSVRGTRFGVVLASDGRSSTSVQAGSVAVQALALAAQKSPQTL
ncbi:MAG: FecR domain-containing protein, partial [Giesbergeria sp.]|nr:FecR domain-containing protein [Giesbergeria sp.]